MLTPKEAAERCGISVSLVYQWCREGLFEYLRLGGKGKRGKVLIDQESFERFLESCKHQQAVRVPLRHIK